MHHILFVTGNTEKFKEVQRWLKELDPSIILEQAKVDLPEIQSLDVQKVALSKAKEAWNLFKKPLLIDDGGIYLEKYNKFPGTLSKYVFEGIGLEGVWLLAKEDPRTYFLCCLVYVDGPDSYQLFEGISRGITIQPRHAVKNLQLPYTEIFIPTGSEKTFSELKGTEEEKLYHHRLRAIKKLVDWLKINS